MHNVLILPDFQIYRAKHINFRFMYKFIKFNAPYYIIFQIFVQLTNLLLN